MHVIIYKILTYLLYEIKNPTLLSSNVVCHLSIQLYQEIFEHRYNKGWLVKILCGFQVSLNTLFYMYFMNLQIPVSSMHHNTSTQAHFKSCTQLLKIDYLYVI